MVVDGQEWTARTLESVLSPEGFAVLKAYTGEQALQLAKKTAPDVFIINARLPDSDGLALCERLRETPAVDDTTPILLLTTAPLSRVERIHALRNGAWDILQLPFDPEEIVLRVRRYLRAREALRIGLERGLIDPDTGVYNEQGLLRRVAELASDARRSARTLGCVLLGPETVDGESPFVTVLERAPDGGPGEVRDDFQEVRAIAEKIVEQTRLSDSFGRLGQARYAILAPGTDLGGVQILTELLPAAVAGFAVAVSFLSFAYLSPSYFLFAILAAHRIVVGNALKEDVMRWRAWAAAQEEARGPDAAPEPSVLRPAQPVLEPVLT
jgi:DNA-binding response OmpR family regulator